MNSAFACEIYLKCLFFLEQGKTIWGHDLAKLFSNLQAETQAAITTRFDTANSANMKERAAIMVLKTGRTMPTFFAETLVEAAKAFKGWRYIFEKDKPMAYALFPLPQFLWQIIVKRKPNLLRYSTDR